MLYPYGKLKPGEWLLVLGASSGVGVASIQTGKYIGAKVIGTSGSGAKLERLKATGMDVGIETRAGDFAAQVKEITGGRGVDLIVNNVGGSVFPEGIRALAHKGRLATVGYVDGVFKAELDLNRLHAERLEVFGVSNSRLSIENKAETTRGFIRDLMPGFSDGRIVPLVDRVFPLDQIAAAKAYMESNAQVGKIVVRVA
jgi:NADPH:quinone reductase-like Zn-dependent oxidoreductase